MNLDFIIKGIIIGFSIAAPVGPIGVLCIRRSLNKGFLSGFFTGLGAATADATYGAVAGFGLTLISSFLVNYRNWIQAIGIAFLIYLGIRIFFEKPAAETKENIKNRGLFLDYLSTFGLTITNPTTIVSFAAIFAGIGVFNTAGNYISASLLVLGVFIGSVIWWLILISGISLLRKKTNTNILKWVNRISGVTLIAFALVLILNLIKS
jgi:threonine/homoserine/homoserine lactone efflux protein